MKKLKELVADLRTITERSQPNVFYNEQIRYIEGIEAEIERLSNDVPKPEPGILNFDPTTQILIKTNISGPNFEIKDIHQSKTSEVNPDKIIETEPMLIPEDFKSKKGRKPNPKPSIGE